MLFALRSLLISNTMHWEEGWRRLLMEKQTQYLYVRYYQSDALGSIIALTDETGTVRTTYSYDPFGNVTVSGEPSDNPFQYTGRENDETGLYYYRFRYYSSELQRFISEDPVGLLGGINKYIYVGNRPARYIDPLGLARGDWWDPRTYISLSMSFTGPSGEGTVMYVGGGEQQSHSPLTLVGVSLDIQVGLIPPLSNGTYEYGVGFGKHLALGYFATEPNASGSSEYGGLVLHIGPGFGSIIYGSWYDPVNFGISGLVDKELHWTKRDPCP
jgi:RHS repeat-associated protein